MTSKKQIFGDNLLDTIHFVTSADGVVSTKALTISGSFSYNTCDNVNLFWPFISGTAPIAYSSTTGVLAVNGGGTPTALLPDATPSAGTSASVAYTDHAHPIATAAPLSDSIGTTLRVGTATSFSRSDHQHIGVRSVSVNGSAQLFGNITLAQQNNVVISLTGQNISFSITRSEEIYVLAETQSLGTNGGAYSTAKSYQNRFINRMLYAGASNVFLNSAATTNTDFTLNPGTYLINARATMISSDQSLIRLFNVTTGVGVQNGNNMFSGGATNSFANSTNTESKLCCQITIATATVFRLQSYATSANTNTYCTGFALSVPLASYELYATIIIKKM